MDRMEHSGKLPEVKLRDTGYVEVAAREIERMTRRIANGGDAMVRFTWNEGLQDSVMRETLVNAIYDSAQGFSVSIQETPYGLDVTVGPEKPRLEAAE